MWGGGGNGVVAWVTGGTQYRNMVRRQVRNPLYPLTLCTPCCSHFLLSPIFFCLQNERFMVSTCREYWLKKKLFAQACLWARKHFEPFHLMFACPTLLRYEEILVGGRGLRVIEMDSHMSVPSISSLNTFSSLWRRENVLACWSLFFPMDNINNCTSIEEEGFRS